MEQALLLSLHPEFAAAILAGTKKVEYRRRRIARPVTTVYLYATAETRRTMRFWKDRAKRGLPSMNPHE